MFEALPFMMLSNHSFPFVLLICEVKTHSNTAQRDCWFCAHFSGAGVCRNQNTTRKIILRNIMKALLIDRWLNATNNDWIYELHFCIIPWIVDHSSNRLHWCALFGRALIACYLARFWFQYNCRKVHCVKCHRARFPQQRLCALPGASVWPRV